MHSSVTQMHVLLSSLPNPGQIPQVICAGELLAGYRTIGGRCLKLQKPCTKVQVLHESRLI